MIKNLFDTLMPVTSSTGLEIDIYTPTGELVFSTGSEPPSYKFVYHDVSAFTDTVILDKSADVSYFLIDSGSKRYVGVITGSNDVSFNYAVIVCKLAEKALSPGEAKPEKKSKFGRLLSGELNKTQYETLKSEFAGKKLNYYVLSIVVSAPSKLSELTAFLEAMAQGSDIVTEVDHKTAAYFKECDGGSDYSSANDFAYILYDNIKEELRIDMKINVGGAAAGFDELPEAYRKSLLAYNFGTLFDPVSNVYSYKEYLMIKMLSDIPRDSLNQYFSTLLDKQSREILSDSELMDTAEAFMKNSLNIAETSRTMYMHRNTLIYRLDKIESLTGLNLRHFNDALIFRLITILNKLTKK